jgi:hypothetical protein
MARILGEETELCVFKSLADLLHPSHFADTALDLQVRQAMGMNSVAPSFLCQKASDVGGLQRILGSVDIACDHKANAACGFERHSIPRESVPLNFSPQTFRKTDRAIGDRFRKQYPKFITP